VDFDRYIQEAESILEDLGFYGAKAPPIKPKRVTKANRDAVLQWALAI